MAGEPRNKMSNGMHIQKSPADSGKNGRTQTKGVSVPHPAVPVLLPEISHRSQQLDLMHQIYRQPQRQTDWAWNSI
jgi:hypothetical protein